MLKGGLGVCCRVAWVTDEVEKKVSFVAEGDVGKGDAVWNNYGQKVGLPPQR